MLTISLYRPQNLDDIPEYTDVQRVLREEIVNPLRKKLFVRADKVMKLRRLLDDLTSVRGLTSEEKGTVQCYILHIEYLQKRSENGHKKWMFKPS